MRLDNNSVVSLADLKTMLCLTTDDQDALLNLIINQTVAQTRFKIGLSSSDAFPSELAYIPLEVSVRRYNRVRNEGMKSYSQEGETLTFNDNDFADFIEDIDSYQERNNLNGKSYGKARFINAYHSPKEKKQCDLTLK